MLIPRDHACSATSVPVDSSNISANRQCLSEGVLLDTHLIFLIQGSFSEFYKFDSHLRRNFFIHPFICQANHA